MRQFNHLEIHTRKSRERATEADPCKQAQPLASGFAGCGTRENPAEQEGTSEVDAESAPRKSCTRMQQPICSAFHTVSTKRTQGPTQRNPKRGKSRGAVHPEISSRHVRHCRRKARDGTCHMDSSGKEPQDCFMSRVGLPRECRRRVGKNTSLREFCCFSRGLAV